MGVLIALLIMVLWSGHLVYILNYVVISFSSPLMYLHIFLQAYLYTGLFITAHDAMHGTVSPNKKVNRAVGTMAAFLFAGMSYKRLINNHFMHHHKPGEDEDPDFSMRHQNFFLWWFTFMVRYTTIMQLIVMAAAFNILKIWFDELRLWLLWVIPAFMGTLQLFYFGTYLPHRYPHKDRMKPHNARTQRRNHLWAMLSCYFFGYHYEHHENPRIPWWQLYKVKDRKTEASGTPVN